MASLFQFTDKRLTPAPGQLIVKADDAAAFFEAEKLLARVREEEKAIRASADEIYEKRRAEGYQDGIMAGKMEYSAKILETVMSSVEYLESLETSIVRLVGEVTRKLIGEMDHEEVIVRLVRQALNSARSERKVLIRVAARDEAAVRRDLAALLQQRDGGAAGFLDILPDPELPPGSCILESEMGVIEASLETQLKNMEKTLLKHVKRQKAED
ncbi:MAG: HrpE/YscL family type III secretion apparatus protein [Zoogloeaceae bacterium]|jgi:type III secretion protein L|nr:HrpE/YscL family type III secretion apparatus protein [Zoogloeaceae bacterium]